MDGGLVNTVLGTFKCSKKLNKIYVAGYPLGKGLSDDLDGQFEGASHHQLNEIKAAIEKLNATDNPT